MQICFGYACSFGCGHNHVEEIVSCDRSVGSGGEEWVVGTWVFAGDQILPEVALGGVGDVDISLLVAFAVADIELTFFLIVVLNLQVAEFTGPDAGLH